MVPTELHRLGQIQPAVRLTEFSVVGGIRMSLEISTRGMFTIQPALMVIQAQRTLRTFRGRQSIRGYKLRSAENNWLTY